jgi:hypothetical protein
VLDGVSCASPTPCTAVGWARPGTPGTPGANLTQPLVEQQP